MARGTPGSTHWTSGSPRGQLSAFSAFRSRAHSWYGIAPFSTTPNPAGAAPTAPSSTAALGFATCGSMSQCADPRACQIPFRSGLPSPYGDRGAW